MFIKGKDMHFTLNISLELIFKIISNCSGAFNLFVSFLLHAWIEKLRKRYGSYIENFLFLALILPGFKLMSST